MVHRLVTRLQMGLEWVVASVSETSCCTYRSPTSQMALLPHGRAATILLEQPCDFWGTPKEHEVEETRGRLQIGAR